MKKRVLVACETSGRVREAFRKRGFHTVSVDLLPCDNASVYHYQMDIFQFLKRYPIWDLMIAHPTCTYLCNSGVCWLHTNKGSRTKKNYTCSQCQERWKQLLKAIKFFNALANYTAIPHRALENPIPHKFARDGWGDFDTGKQVTYGIGKYDQLIQPYQFGHPETKATCLWLHNLPKLQPTNVVRLPKDKKKRMRLHYLPPSKDRWKIRSVTYQGIADAMAKQWGDYIESL